LPFASSSVTVIVAVATPSPKTAAGLAVTVDTAADTAPAVKVTEAVCVSGSASVASVAEIVLVPALVELTLPVTRPSASVGAAGWVIVSGTPRDDRRVTVFPLTGLPLVSRSVTVIVVVDTPSAVTVLGLAVTVDVAAETLPGMNVAVAVCVTVTPSDVSIAVIAVVPAVVDRTVPVVCPFASVTAAGWTIVSVAPREEANVTFLPATGLLFASRSVMVIVAVVVPSATTVTGLAATVDVLADTAPTVHVTSDVGGSPAAFVFPVVPATPSVTVIVIGPSAN
jgi:hypothetical protein